MAAILNNPAAPPDLRLPENGRMRIFSVAGHPCDVQIRNGRLHPGHYGFQNIHHPWIRSEEAVVPYGFCFAVTTPAGIPLPSSEMGGRIPTKEDSGFCGVYIRINPFRPCFQCSCVSFCNFKPAVYTISFLEIVVPFECLLVGPPMAGVEDDDVGVKVFDRGILNQVEP